MDISLSILMWLIPVYLHHSSDSPHLLMKDLTWEQQDLFLEQNISANSKKFYLFIKQVTIKLPDNYWNLFHYLYCETSAHLLFPLLIEWMSEIEW